MIVIVDPVADVSIPSPPDMVKSTDPLISLIDPESVVNVTPVISPPPPLLTDSQVKLPEPSVVKT